MILIVFSIVLIATTPIANAFILNDVTCSENVIPGGTKCTKIDSTHNHELARAEVYGDHGILKGIAIANSSGSDFENAFGRVGFRDVVTILPPPELTDKLLGKVGIWRFAILTDNRLDNTPQKTTNFVTISSSHYLTLNAWTPGFPGMYGSVSKYTQLATQGWGEDIGYGGITQKSDHAFNYGGSAYALEFGDNTFYTWLPFIFGKPIEIEMIMALSVYARYGTTIADASHSTYWAGTLGVFSDSTGIDGYSITTLSGTDYHLSMVPVAEPSSWLMLAIGLTCLVGNHRVLRRRASSNPNPADRSLT